MTDYLVKEDVFMALTGDITDCTIEEFIARLREKLSKLPSIGKDINVTTNEDYISRQAVNEGFKKYANSSFAYGCVWDYINKLPSVTPKEKTGKWIKTQSGDDMFPEIIVCSKCNNENSHLDFNEHAEPIGKVFIKSKYCPNCGARMVSE